MGSGIRWSSTVSARGLVPLISHTVTDALDLKYCNIRTMGDYPAAAQHRNCAKICWRRHGTCNHTCPKECHDGDDCGLCFFLCEVNIPCLWLYYPDDTTLFIQPFYLFLTGLFLNKVRSDVSTCDATRNATRPVHHTFKTTLRPMSVMTATSCLVQHLATAFNARNACFKKLTCSPSMSKSLRRGLSVELLSSSALNNSIQFRFAL